MRRLAPALSLLALGCVAPIETGEPAVWGFGTLSVILLALGCVGLFVAALVLRRRGRLKAAAILGGAALMFLLVGVPGLLLDRVEVSQQGFKVESGLWFARRSWEIDFAECEAIALQGTGTQSVHFLRCYPKGGGEPQRVPAGPLLRGGAAQAIIERAGQRGVEIRYE